MLISLQHLVETEWMCWGGMGLCSLWCYGFTV